MLWHKLLFISLLALISALPGVGQDIFEPEIMEVHINFQEKDWHVILKEQKQANIKTGLLAEVRVGGEVYDSVRVRFKGNSSFHGALKAGVRKLPFRLKAKKGDRFAGDYKEFKLSNNYRDPSYIRELLAYRIVSDYMPVPRVKPAIVFVNEQYLGVYTATEGVEKPMLTRYFGSEKGALIKCEPDFKANPAPGCPRGSYASLEYLGDDPECYKIYYEVDDRDVWDALITLTLALEERPEHVGNFLNVDQVLWMHALNNVLVNLDSYLGIFCHNYYMYQDTAGIFHPLIWDLNLAFGGFHGLKQGVRPDLVKLSPIIHARAKMDDRPLLTQLLKIERHRHTYYAYMRQIVDDWFAEEQYLAYADELREMLRPWVKRETQGLYSEYDFEKSLFDPVKRGETRTIIGIAELMTPRTIYLLKHPLLERASRDVSQ